MRAALRKTFQAIAEDVSKKIEDVECSDAARLEGVTLILDFLGEVESQLLMSMPFDAEEE